MNAFLLPESKWEANASQGPFNKHIKDNNWAVAAKESNRRGIGADRNKYVKELLNEAAEAVAEIKV